MIWHDLQTELDARADQHLTRELKRAPDGALDLASNDYLGLATHPRVVEAAQQAAAKYGAGARASRLVSGHFDLIEELEAELARFKGTEAALVFSSGYAANLGVVTALCDAQTALFCHKRNHASLLDACKLAGAKTRFWESSDKLRALLESSNARRKIIVCDGVFSMDGDLCDLPSLLELADEFDALILLDDAHGTGTLGRTGRGLIEHFGECGSGLGQGRTPPLPSHCPGSTGRPLPPRGGEYLRYFRGDCVQASSETSEGILPLSEGVGARRSQGSAKAEGVCVPDPNHFQQNQQNPLPSQYIVTLGTLSKALGSQGGFVCGPQVLIDYLVGAARAFVYSTGLNPPAVGAALAALRVIEAEPQRVQKCRDNAAFLARELGALGFEVAPQPSPILPIFAADSAAALEMSARLLKRDLWCPAIRPPTVKRARLRLTSNASWDEATLARIVAGFA